MARRVKIRVRSVPYHRPGAGVGLLTFCALVTVWTFKATVLVAKWTIVAVAALVAVVAGVVGEWRAGRR